MIYKDGAGLPLDQTMDAGDSAVRISILTLAYGAGFGVSQYVDSDGVFVRHPTQVPWNNPKNVSRDQIIMLLAAYKKLGCSFEKFVRSFFVHTLKRGFFAQNFERDYPGTTKYPWPHKVNGKWRLFDFADPLPPNHIGAIIIAGRIRVLYPLLLVCYPIHLVMLALHSCGSHHEENQMIAECYIYGTLKLYRRWHPNWMKKSSAYWTRRNEIEYHHMLVRLVEFI